MTRYTEDGEELEFIGLNEFHTRGYLGTDGMGRYSLPGCNGLYGLMPPNVDAIQYSEHDEEDEKYVFDITVTVHRIKDDEEEDGQ